MNLAQRLIFAACASLALVSHQAGAAAPAAAAAPPPVSQIGTPTVVSIGPGDQVRIEVFGNDDLSTTVNVAENGSITVPLVGNMNIGGQSPAEAARRIEVALKDGQFLNNPQVTVYVLQVFTQRVTVLGEVTTPGRYPVGFDSTLFDLIAQAGGVTAKGSDIVYILREDESGKEQRIAVDMGRMLTSQGANTAAMKTKVKGGDSILVPKATFFISGAVANPGEFRIEGGMLLYEAVARAGGLTPVGSMSHVEIQRRDANNKPYKVKKVNKNLKIEPGDVIEVGERWF